MSDAHLPLHAMDPLGRFTNRAADYAQFRPDYPGAAFDAMLAGLGEPHALLAADVGAGTGISARQLASAGPRVVAIEPNAAMRAAATPHPRVSWQDGTAESTGLPDGAVDLVLCAQAFHWFRQPEVIAEFQRVLRPGGRLALMWNNRDPADPLTHGYIAAIHAVGGEHPAETRAFDPGVIDRDGRFTPARLVTIPHAQRLTLEGLIGRATSASYVPREGPALEELRARLTELFARHRDAADTAAMRYVTNLYLADRL